MPRKRPILALALTAGALALPSSAAALPLPGAPGCPIFPADNQWNQRVDGLAVAQDSGAIVASIGLDEGLHPDFGSGRYNGAPIGIPFKAVPGSQPKARVRFQYADESDRGPYPIPSNVPIEGGRRSDGDRHVLLVDRDACRLYELYATYPTRNSRRWRAGSGAIWDLRSNALRPEGLTSADAAGLPILPGLARYDEVRTERIDHALRFTVERSRRAFVYPARHFASDLDDASLPAMGQRLRLKSAVNIAGYPPQAQVVLQAMKEYGLIVADNGSDWFVSGAPDPGWDNDDLRQLGGIKGSDFEVVDTSTLPRPG